MGTTIQNTPDISKNKQVLLMIAIALIAFFNNGDTSLLSTAAPTIIANLGGAELYS